MRHDKKVGIASSEYVTETKFRRQKVKQERFSNIRQIKVLIFELAD
jgi:hypothetical protein